MKRVLSILLAAVLLFTVMPFAVFADESEASERDRLVAQACEVFPEYASMIRGEYVAPQSLPQDGINEKLFEEHRDISDTTTMSIVGYMSGDVYVTKQTTRGYEITYSTSNVSSGVTGVRGFVSFDAFCTNVPGLFKLKDVQFQILYNASDYFMSYGTAIYDGTTTQVNKDAVVLSASRMNYPITFNANAAGSAQVQIDFGVAFLNDKVYACMIV
ncbi:MAG: hypothetical protein KHX05_07280 [Firmicutes bacterium]|nr:hypothetical protein [Bacillota bacterium]